MQAEFGRSAVPGSTSPARFADVWPAATTLIHIWPSNAPHDEDAGLTSFLVSAWRKLHSASRRPPRCPRCRGGTTACDGTDHRGLPQFHCHRCQRRFNRLTGTPMARLRPQESKVLAFFSLASQPIPVAEAARRLGINPETVVRWSIQTRLWLLELDPQGSWEQRVHLAVRYAVLPADRPGSAPLTTLGCRCSPVCSGTAQAGATDEVPALLRVCPFCEQTGHPSQSHAG